MNRITMLYDQILETTNKVHHEKGKNKLLIIFDLLKCLVIYGASPNNYYKFDFINATPKERQTFITHRYSNRLMKLLNQPNNIKILQDKFAFANKFKAFFGRGCLKNTSMTFVDFHELISLNQNIIYKPLCGSRGANIQVYNVNFDNEDAIFSELKHLQEGVVETWIDQHDAMMALYPRAVNPIRIVTVNVDGAVHCISARLTIGNGIEIANASDLHSIFALVNLETGVVFSEGCDNEGRHYKNHPQTGKNIKGFTIPNWNRLIDTVKRAAAEIPGVGYIGWDLAVTENGAVLIEGNNDPGYTVYQLPKLTGTHIGAKLIFEKYIKL